MSVVGDFYRCEGKIDETQVFLITTGFCDMCGFICRCAVEFLVKHQWQWRPSMYVRSYRKFKSTRPQQMLCCPSESSTRSPESGDPFEENPSANFLKRGTESGSLDPWASVSGLKSSRGPLSVVPTKSISHWKGSATCRRPKPTAWFGGTFVWASLEIVHWSCVLFRTESCVVNQSGFHRLCLCLCLSLSHPEANLARLRYPGDRQYRETRFQKRWDMPGKILCFVLASGSRKMRQLTSNVWYIVKLYPKRAVRFEGQVQDFDRVPVSKMTACNFRGRDSVHCRSVALVTVARKCGVRFLWPFVKDDRIHIAQDTVESCCVRRRRQVKAQKSRAKVVTVVLRGGDSRGDRLDRANVFVFHRQTTSALPRWPPFSNLYL